MITLYFLLLPSLKMVLLFQMVILCYLKLSPNYLNLLLYFLHHLHLYLPHFLLKVSPLQVYYHYHLSYHLLVYHRVRFLAQLLLI